MLNTVVAPAAACACLAHAAPVPIPPDATTELTVASHRRGALLRPLR